MPSEKRHAQCSEGHQAATPQSHSNRYSSKQTRLVFVHGNELTVCMQNEVLNYFKPLLFHLGSPRKHKIKREEREKY